MDGTTEEQKMLEYLRENGITTLDELKNLFNRFQNYLDESLDEEVIFVNEIPATRTISKEQLALLMEASTRYKEKLMNDLKKIEEPAEPALPPQPAQLAMPAQTPVPAMPHQIVQYTSTVVVNPSNNMVYADCSQNTTTLPMRYRHKHTQASYQKGQRSHHGQPRTRPSRQSTNNNVPSYNQYNQNQYGQNRSQYGGSNMVSTINYNNTCGGYVYPMGNTNMSIPITQTLSATPGYSPMHPQQHDWTRPVMPNSSHSAYNFNNYNPMAQMQAVCPQASMQETQQPCTQFLNGSRSIFDTS